MKFETADRSAVMPRVLILSEMFPNVRYPLLGVFVEELVRHIQTHCHQEVISPIPYVPFPLNLIPRYRGWTSDDTQGQFATVHRPRYLLFPRGLWHSKLGDSYWASIRKLAGRIRYDVIHAHQPFPDGFAGLRLKRRSGKPLVVTIHGDVTVQRILESPVLRKVVKQVLDNADAIINVARYQKGFCEEIGVEDLSKIVHIPNGVDTGLFQPLPDRDAIRRRLGLPVNKRVVMYIGNLYAPKGLSILLDSVAKLVNEDNDKSFELVLVGGGPLRKPLVNQAKRAGILGNVKFVGSKPHDEIPLWLGSADMIVLPSLQEGFPTVIPEALACGTPVVATKVGGIPDAGLEPDMGILAQSGDSESLKGAIQSALRKDWDRELIAKHGARYDWNRIAERTLQVYSKVLLPA